MAKTVSLRDLAASDLADASEHYRREAGEQKALDFVDAVERGSNRISRSPHVGSLRFAYELAIPGLRALPVHRFPYIVFYVDAQDVIDVWRVLHTRRDIPAALEPSSELAFPTMTMARSASSPSPRVRRVR